MRLAIDMQGAQTANRHRGIGRYTISLTKELVRLRGEHEVILVLNSRFPDSIDYIKAAFKDLLPASSIEVIDFLESIKGLDSPDDARRKAAEMTREAVLARLQVDIILIFSLFESGGEDFVSSIGSFSRRVPTAVLLHDLIPLIHSEIYLRETRSKSHYLRKIDHLRRADLILANSESTRSEAIDYLGIPSEQVVHISTACDAHYKPTDLDESALISLRQKFGLVRSVLMYTGGINPRKNLERLVVAYAKLPRQVRDDHQLVIVCAADEVERAPLHELAKSMGLNKDEVVITGYVSDDEMLALYNICKAFVFPSWHEGFGIPVLEAMACGRPVIGSNTSSIPEVIGREDALFDPYDEEAMARKIEQVLTDEGFRCSLQAHGQIQAQKFSWELTGRRAWDALIKCASERQKPISQLGTPYSPRPRLAYISPLPPEKSGISDYSAELLPELSRHYEIDVIVAQDSVSDAWVVANHPVRDHAWFLRNAGRYERVLYHFGNSAFHEHMFGLLNKVPGVVVLHDFFLGNIVSHLDYHGILPHIWPRALLKAHGWPAVKERFKAKELSDVLQAYPCNIDVVQQALGLIVHSEHSLNLGTALYGKECTDGWTLIPHLRKPVVQPDRRRARRKLGLDEDAFIVCSFGLLAPHKGNQRLLSAWRASALSREPKCQLVFVGENSGSHGEEITEFIKANGLANSVKITGWTDEETYRTWLQAANLGIQLRIRSLGETSGTVLDCMNVGLAIVVNATGSMANLSTDAVWMMPGDFPDEELIKALEMLWTNADLRRSFATRAREIIHTRHSPRQCAEQYRRVIEQSYKSESEGRRALVSAVAAIEPPLAPGDREQVALMLANNFPLKPRKKQLLIDISELVQVDVKSGIQRVVRGILQELLQSPPAGWAIEPVYEIKEAAGFRYARRFTCDFLGIPHNWTEDEPVEAWAGDIFLGLDLNPRIAASVKKSLVGWQHRGVRTLFVVYDLLPILIPEAFPPEASHFEPWLKTVCEFDGVICISRAASEALNHWNAERGPKRERPLPVSWFHLGADFKSCAPSEGASEESAHILSEIRSRPSFLTVATIEPRKRHAQILEAFELLWSEGIDVNFVIVGKQGWMVEPLIDQLRAHPELGKRLFWLEGISDGYLESVYSSCACLIAASIGEGFGLPLIEAAQHKLPIIARDIPVFREVAGMDAYYFSGNSARELGDSIRHWLALYKQNNHPKSDGLPWLNWKQSTQQLLERVFEGSNES